VLSWPKSRPQLAFATPFSSALDCAWLIMQRHKAHMHVCNPTLHCVPWVRMQLLPLSRSLLTRVMRAVWPQIEEHVVDGQLKKLLVHRKGSTRAFPPHHPLIPVDYQLTGKQAACWYYSMMCMAVEGCLPCCDTRMRPDRCRC
jgi:hypothetical protein